MTDTVAKQTSVGQAKAAEARKARGDRTRQAILEVAVDVASAEGLEGLTIGRLASELSMSKSGLFAHFGSKEELQLATVEAARDIFIREVIRPCFEAGTGLPRLWKLCDVWLAYVRGEVFRGGCFFAAAAAEFDGRPGPVRDRIAGIMKEWLATLRGSINEAREAGQLSADADPSQLAFELNALEMGQLGLPTLRRQAGVRARERRDARTPAPSLDRERLAVVAAAGKKVRGRPRAGRGDFQR